jgi:hypothetical protein
MKSLKLRYSKRFQTILPKITRISAQYLEGAKFEQMSGLWLGIALQYKSAAKITRQSASTAYGVFPAN